VVALMEARPKLSMWGGAMLTLLNMKCMYSLGANRVDIGRWQRELMAD
jgi:hypothetical protein